MLKIFSLMLHATMLPIDVQLAAKFGIVALVLL